MCAREGLRSERAQDPYSTKESWEQDFIAHFEEPRPASQHFSLMAHDLLGGKMSDKPKVPFSLTLTFSVCAMPFAAIQPRGVLMTFLLFSPRRLLILEFFLTTHSVMQPIDIQRDEIMALILKHIITTLFSIEHPAAEPIDAASTHAASSGKRSSRDEDTSRATTVTRAKKVASKEPQV